MKYIKWLVIILALVVGVWSVQEKHSAQNDLVTAWNETCTDPSNGNRTTCFKKALTQTVGTYGVDAAFEGIAALYDEDSSFGGLCHDFTHLLGQQAYKEFQTDHALRVSTKTAYCAFGFYHGFMETLLSSGGSIEEARKLCALVRDQLGDEAPNAVLACYHGVGHGSVDSHNPTNWGNERALIAPALALCRQFAKEREQLKLCGTGVFDSLALEYYNYENNFSMRKDDPLWICREQEEVFTEACYMDMMPAMLWMGNYDLAEAAPLVARYAEEGYRALAIKELANGSIRQIVGKKDPVSYLAVCRKLSADLTLPCVAGLGAGVMQFGRLDMEYADGLAFCGRDELVPAEKDACFASVFSYVQGRYSQKKASRICDESPSEYQKYCKG